MEKKHTTSTEAEWIKCRSKTRPGHFYMFNKTTGETKWCSSESDGISTISNTERAVSKTPKKEKEPLPPKFDSISKSVRTPAQDRLKRLQDKLKKEKSTKVLTEAKGKNSNMQRKNNNNDVDNNKVNKIKETQNQKTRQLEKALCSYNGGTSDTVNTKSDKTPNYVLPKSPTKSSTKTTRKRALSPEKTTKHNIDAYSTSAKTPKISAGTTTNEEELTAPALTDSASTSSFGSGIFNKIIDICKSTINTAKKSTSSVIKKPSFKKTTSKTSQQGGSAALKAAYNDIRSSNEQSTSTTDKQFVLKEISKAATNAASTNCSTPKNLVPNYPRGSANARLDRLRMSLSLQPSTSKQSQVYPPVSPCASVASDNKSVNSSTISYDIEPMDWQETEQNEITKPSITNSSIPNASRVSNSMPDSNEIEYYDTVNENLLRFSAEKQSNSKWLHDYYYFVIDTNVLLENITFIDDLTKMKLCATKGTMIYIPYIVLQELDKLKIRARTESAKVKTVLAIKYLNTQFKAQNKQIRAQSASDERKHLIDITSPDDSILNCCLQVKQHVENVILLTEDVNLRNKAICNNLLVSTKSDLVSHHAKSPSSNSWCDAK